MRIGSRGFLPLVAALVLVAAACSTAPAATISPTEAPAGGATTEPAPQGLPYTATLKDGSTFTLNQRVVDKLAKGEPVNYVFSYGSTAIPLFSPQYKNGYERTLPEAQKILPMNGQAIAPASAVQDMNEQIAQIDALFKADQIDCLSIQTTGTDAFTKIVNDIMATGIPVFTVGVQSNGNEFTNFTQISLKEGRQAAGIVVDFMKKNGLDFKVFAVSGGDPTQNWAQGRMQGFIDGIKEAIPDATFVNDASTALVTTYDPAGTYDAYKAFIQGNPEVQVIENVDIGGEHAARAIADSGNAGKMYALGWNVSIGQLDAIEAGTQIVALDQQWGEQAGFGALACAEFLKNGNILPNSQVLLPVTKDNVVQAREEFMKIAG
ncbi:MAG TPA: substrate-binding domain-containing protein [Candidatus Sulfomarinibacteraceae bacterium]|nr:substrate-binding domain-containing protein [Candidatus Sulfomarinibacteraceae bacterium]